MKNLFLYLLCAFALACQAQNPSKETTKTNATGDKVVKTKVEWQKCLSPEQYRILREKGTEQAFTGKYYNHHEKGVYTCGACGSHLFTSETKFDSGTGWPSYWQPVNAKSVKTKTDQSYGMDRVEVLCARCDGHLGHVFEDGPKPTGLRYCINSASLNFVKVEKTVTNSKENTKPKN